MPGDDEQGVVDAHAEADHGAEDQGELGDIHHCGQQADPRHTDEDPDQRGADGQAHRHDGAERYEQDDDRHADADELTARLLRRQQGEGTGQLDLHTIRLGPVGHGHGIVQLLGRQLVERVGDVEVGGLPIGAHGRRLWRQRVGHAGDVGASRELLASPLDGRGVPGAVEASGVGVEHDASGQSALAREAVGEHVGGVLGLDARHPLAVVELAAGAALQRDDDDDDQQPGPEHPERVTGAAAAEAVQECAHGVLLGLAPRSAGRGHHPGGR